MFSKRLVAAACVAASAVVHLPATAALTAAAGQFSAKLYTEGLGRLPDQPGWNAAVNYWNNTACNLASLQDVSRNLLTSNEFLSSAPSSQEKIFRLYRAALGRNATVAELTNGINLVNGGANWTTLVNNLLGSAEFTNRFPGNCNEVSGWQPTQAANVRITNTNAIDNETALQNALNAAAPGGTVYLDQGTVILLTKTLNVPSGRTLATVGSPGAGKAPLLARIARNGGFKAPLITMQDNSRLESVWVDGQRSIWKQIGGVTVQVQGDGVNVTRNILSDSTGFTHLHYYKQLEEGECRGGIAADNLILAYGSKHKGSAEDAMSDGIGIACSNVIVERNQIVDASDVGIVAFRPYPKDKLNPAKPGVQNSVIRNNVIFNPGNSAFAALAADPLSDWDAPFVNLVPVGTVLDFTGLAFSNNTIWTSPAVHLDFILSSGTRAWFGPHSYTGKGARFLNNTSGTGTITASIHAGVSGMLQTVMDGNTFNVISQNTNLCGQGKILVAPQPYANDAGTSIAPGADVTVVSASHLIVANGGSGCVGAGH